MMSRLQGQLVDYNSSSEDDFDSTCSTDSEESESEVYGSLDESVIDEAFG